MKIFSIERNRFLLTFLVAMVCGGMMRIALAADPPKRAAFKEFTQRVEQYVKLRKTMPRQRTTKKREEIVERRRTLSQKSARRERTLNRAASSLPKLAWHFNK